MCCVMLLLAGTLLNLCMASSEVKKGFTDFLFYIQSLIMELHERSKV
jgi:hypothetical protein